MNHNKPYYTKTYLTILSLVILLFSGCASLHPPPATAPEPALREAAKPLIPETRPPEIINPPANPQQQTETAPARVIHTVWDALDSRRHFYPDATNPRIAAQIQRYTSEPGYIPLVMERARPFLFHILQRLEQKNMPAELALLPVIESAYLSNARSRHGARGLWQIMPATGRELGLKIDWWYDGRRDIVASTEAALAYLHILNQRLEGDWLLTLAAYNAGFTTIARAVENNRRKGLPTDFWHLQLPDETANYVPRFLAVVEMIGNPQEYAITLPDIPWQPGFSHVALNKPVDLHLLARHARVDLQKLQRLNPGFKRGITPARGTFTLLASPEEAERLHASIRELPAASLAKGQKHRVVSGETLSHISRHYGVTVAALRQVNQLSSDRIRAGATLIIPATPSSRLPSETTPAGLHVVQRGDTLWGIARRYRISVQKLAQLNAMSVHEILRPGLELIVQDG